jgi:hypothetical protein
MSKATKNTNLGHGRYDMLWMVQYWNGAAWADYQFYGSEREAKGVARWLEGHGNRTRVVVGLTCH